MHLKSKKESNYFSTVNLFLILSVLSVGLIASHLELGSGDGKSEYFFE